MEEQPQAPEYAEGFSEGTQPNGKGSGHPVHGERINKRCYLLHHEEWPAMGCYFSTFHPFYLVHHFSNPVPFVTA